MRWIFGDIHGMFGSLQGLLEAVSKADSSPRLLFSGDYVNRGPDSEDVIELLTSLSNAQFIRGNHDDIFDEILSGGSYATNASEGDRMVAFEWFMQFGLDQTLTSYGADWAELDWMLHHGDEHRLASMLRCVSEKHRRFIHDLAGVIEEPDLFVAHGRWDVDDSGKAEKLAERLSGDARLRYQLLWGRFEPYELHRPATWTRRGYFGHTPVDFYAAPESEELTRPIATGKIVLVDTGAALAPAGRLTAFCHETGQYLQVDRQGKLLSQR